MRWPARLLGELFKGRPTCQAADHTADLPAFHVGADQRGNLGTGNNQDLRLRSQAGLDLFDPGAAFSRLSVSTRIRWNPAMSLIPCRASSTHPCHREGHDPL